jgi:hypothetical protein
LKKIILRMLQIDLVIFKKNFVVSKIEQTRKKKHNMFHK